MRNLIYTMSNSLYYPLLHLFLTSLRTHSDVDVCVIIDSKEKIYRPIHKNVFVTTAENLDYRYTGKYDVRLTAGFMGYDNYLYLDADHVCVKSPDDIFKAIANNPKLLHAPIENFSFGDADFQHKFSDKEYRKGTVAYNAGAFGFTREFMDNLPAFVEHISVHSQFVLFDQPLFNEYFNDKELFYPSLSEYIYFECNCPQHTQVNATKKREDICFLHILNGFGDAIRKYGIMREYVKL